MTRKRLKSRCSRLSAFVFPNRCILKAEYPRPLLSHGCCTAVARLLRMLLHCCCSGARRLAPLAAPIRPQQLHVQRFNTKHVSVKEVPVG